MRSTVSARGQTAVPSEVRRRFNLKDRSRLEWLIDGDVITILPLPVDPERSLRGALRGKYSGKDLLRARARERGRARSSG